MPSEYQMNFLFHLILGRHFLMEKNLNIYQKKLLIVVPYIVQWRLDNHLTEKNCVRNMLYLAWSSVSSFMEEVPMECL